MPARAAHRLKPEDEADTREAATPSSDPVGDAPGDGRGPAIGQLLALQRGAGNAATSAWLARTVADRAAAGAAADLIDDDALAGGGPPGDAQTPNPPRSLSPGSASAAGAGERSPPAAQPGAVTAITSLPAGEPGPPRPVPDGAPGLGSPAAGGAPAPEAVVAAPAPRSPELPAPEGVPPPPAPAEPGAATQPEAPPTFEPAGPLPEVELPATAPTPHQQAALDRIATTLRAAQAGLAGTLEAEIGRVRATVDEQQAAVDRSLATELTRVREHFAQAREQMTGQAARESAALASAAEGQSARLSTWHEGARATAGRELETRRQRAVADGQKHATGAGQAAEDAAAKATTNARREADAARAKGQAKAQADGDAEVREAKAAAARELAEETATQVGAGASDAARELRSQGAEVASGLLRQAAQVAGGLGSHLTHLTTHLGEQVAAAARTHATALDGGRSALASQRDQTLTGLATAEQEAVTNLERDAGARRAAIAELGTQVASRLRERAEEVSREGGEAVARTAGALAAEPLDPPTAEAAASAAVAQIGPAYEALSTELRGVGAQAAQGLADTAAGATGSLATAAEQIGGRVSDNAREAGDRAQLAADDTRARLVGVTDGTTGAGDRAVESFTGVLDQHLDGADGAASALLSDFSGSLAAQVGKVGGDLAQPTASLEARIDTAQARAAERAERSWLSNQLHDLWDTVTSPEFLVGLVAGLVVGAIIILSAGTATPFVIAAAAVAGGAAAGAASTMTGNVRQGRGLFDGVLRNTLIGAAAGAVGAGVFLLGGGVVAGLGLGSVGTAIGGFVVLEVGAVAANTIVNVANGDPWDKNLLTSLLLAPLVKYVGERIPGLRGRPQVEDGEPVSKPGATEEPKAAPIAPAPEGDFAILPNGTRVPPTSYSGGYHGTSEVPPSVALSEGLPGRGTNLSLQGHAEAQGNSAFRGTTQFPSGPNPEMPSGAAYWAGEGGWVYEIRNVPTWDVNALLEGRVQTPGGFRGNLMVGEGESAIPARVPPEKIIRYGQVVESRGRLYVKEWVDVRGGSGGGGER